MYALLKLNHIPNHRWGKLIRQLRYPHRAPDRAASASSGSSARTPTSSCSCTRCSNSTGSRAARSSSSTPSTAASGSSYSSSRFGFTRILAFTRYCCTSQLWCGSPSSLYCSPHLQSLPYCNTIARLLRNIRPPTDPPCVCHTPYNIGHGNIV